MTRDINNEEIKKKKKNFDDFSRFEIDRKIRRESRAEKKRCHFFSVTDIPPVLEIIVAFASSIIYQGLIQRN